jgi:hypothetical protein
MASAGRGIAAKARLRKLREATEILRAFGLGPRQTNDVAAQTLLALLDLKPVQPWSEASSPLRGITPIIGFVASQYGLQYAPNTRETIRDEAVKHFVEAGILLKNPDDPARPTNSGKTVYQVEPGALALFRMFGSADWPAGLRAYQMTVEPLRVELFRARTFARIAVRLPSGKEVALSPGGQNPLIKAIFEEFCPRFLPGGVVVYVGDTENKFLHLEADYLRALGVSIPAPAKMPDVIVHDTRRDWLVLIEAVTSAGSVDGKRRKELKELFRGSQAGLVFVSAFAGRNAMRGFLDQIAWETEVWVADNPDHLIHFNGERFLGPYPDVVPAAK